VKSDGLDMRSDGREDDSRIWSESESYLPRACFFRITAAGRSFRLPSKIVGLPSSTKSSDLIVERRPGAFQDNVEVTPDDRAAVQATSDRMIAKGGWSRHAEAYRQSRRRARDPLCRRSRSRKWSGRPLRRESRGYH
jgi:hypothetical protein